MAKKRVSLTLEEDLVERIDSEADRKKLNRSQLVENIIETHFRQQGMDTAAVLCGDPELKTLELYQGKPILSHILDHLVEEGFSRVFLLAGDNQGIEDEYGSSYHDLVLEYVYDEPEGTAAALKTIQGDVSGEFAVLNGHVVSDVDFSDMLRTHREEGSPATMALTSVEDPSDYGVARLKGREILGFVEKPESGNEPSRLINAGSYIFSEDIFTRIEESSLEMFFEKLAGESELSGYIYGGEWNHVDD